MSFFDARPAARAHSLFSLPGRGALALAVAAPLAALALAMASPSARAEGEAAAREPGEGIFRAAGAPADASRSAVESEAAIALGAAPAPRPPVEASAAGGRALGKAEPGKLDPAAAARESDIPVSIDEKKEHKGDSDPIRRALLGAVVLAIGLGVALYYAKRAAKRPAGAKHGAKIQVIGQHFLGPKKSLALVHVAGESLLIGVTENNINLIKALALIDDEVPAHLPNHFDGALDSFEDGQEYPDDPGAYAPAAARRGEESARPPAREDYDSFAMRGLSEIRDVVSGRIGQRKNR